MEDPDQGANSSSSALFGLRLRLGALGCAFAVFDGCQWNQILQAHNQVIVLVHELRKQLDLLGDFNGSGVQRVFIRLLVSFSSKEQEGGSGVHNSMLLMQALQRFLA